VLLLLAFSLILLRGGYVFVAAGVHIAELLLWFEFQFVRRVWACFHRFSHIYCITFSLYHYRVNFLFTLNIRGTCNLWYLYLNFRATWESAGCFYWLLICDCYGAGYTICTVDAYYQRLIDGADDLGAIKCSIVKLFETLVFLNFFRSDPIRFRSRLIYYVILRKLLLIQHKSWLCDARWAAGVFAVLAIFFFRWGANAVVILFVWMDIVHLLDA